MSGFNQSVCKYVFAITLFAATILVTMGTAVAQERKVQGRVENPALGLALTIPPERTATLVQSSSSGIPMLFISVELPKPVGLDFIAEFSEDYNKAPEATIETSIKLLKELGIKDIKRDKGQTIMLGNLPAQKFRVRNTDSDGNSYSQVWIIARRLLQNGSKKLITYTITLGGSSTDVDLSESDLDLLVQSFEVIDIATTPPNKTICRTP
jgi:hypothetical protein